MSGENRVIPFKILKRAEIKQTVVFPKEIIIVRRQQFWKKPLLTYNSAPRKQSVKNKGISRN